MLRHNNRNTNILNEQLNGAYFSFNARDYNRDEFQLSQQVKLVLNFPPVYCTLLQNPSYVINR